jgi:hypothetical protein
MRNYLSPLAEAREISPKGFGSFAVTPIPMGTIVATFGGTIVNRVNFETYPLEQRSRSIQIDVNQFVVGPELREPGDSINHSCLPNCGMRNATQLITMVEIAVGEELTYDYAMSDASEYDEFACGCLTPSCRKNITADDWKRPEIQSRYEGYFSPYIERKIVASKRKRVLTKREVENLVALYDNEPITALEVALRIATGYWHESFSQLIFRIGASFADMSLQLLQRDTAALDWLLTLLNEQRTVES